MNEIISWGLPIFVVLALIALCYNQLQVASRNGDYWIAQGWFGFGALVIVVRLMYWGITSNRNLTLRILVCLFVCGGMCAATVAVFSSINHKRARWIESNQDSTAKAENLVEVKQWYETPEYDLTAKESQTVTTPQPKPQLREKVRPPRKSLQERAEILVHCNFSF